MLRLVVPLILLSVTPIRLAAQGFTNPLLIPPVVSNSLISLNAQNGSVTLVPGFTTASMGYNGNYLGPTILLNKWDSIQFQIHNNLSDTTTVHWHGMHVSPKNDGGPHVVIPPGATWTPTFRVRDQASTHWYHSHLHMRTAEQVTKGLAGLIIVKDSIESALALPRTYGLDDIPLVIQSRAFDLNGQFVVNSALDSLVLINGTTKPFLQVPAQFIRLRLLNGCSMRALNLGLSTNANFYQIASDGGLLATPVPLSRILLAPGERAEILIDLSGMQGQNVQLCNYGNEIPNGIYGAANPAAMGFASIPNYSSNTLNGSLKALLQLNVQAQSPNAISAIPPSLVAQSPINPSLSVVSRSFSFSPKVMGPSTALNGPFVINGTSFDMMTMNFSVTLNTVEIWTLNNNSAIAHPFHLHGVPFQILDINGQAPAANLSGKKDVVLVRSQQTLRFITRFTDFSDDTYPYMYHCHMLVHEDDGMMGQFLVTNPVTGLSEQTIQDKGILVVPNPVKGGGFNLQLNGSEQVSRLVLRDAAGRLCLVYHPDGLLPETSFDTAGLEKGLYILDLNLSNGKEVHTKLLLSE